MGPDIKDLLHMWENDWSAGQVTKSKIKAVAKDPLESATDDQLILELVKRGYAVGRLNDKNQLDV